MDDNLEDDPLEGVSPTRRRFIMGAVAATAFATPLVASYDLSSISPAYAQGSVISNVTTTTTSTVS